VYFPILFIYRQATAVNIASESEVQNDLSSKLYPFTQLHGILLIQRASWMLVNRHRPTNRKFIKIL